jgi:hypothetical protein
MDYRRRAEFASSIYENFNEREMTAEVLLSVDRADSGDYEELVVVPVVFTVCPTCDGKGKYTNPSIDEQGISEEEFERDPEFRKSYFSGRYDIPCEACKGKRVVLALDESRAGMTLTRRVRAHARAVERTHQEMIHDAEMGW